MKPFISVIIATYNSEKTLPLALKAIRAQTYPQDRIEIICADGMSTDRTREIALQYSATVIDNPKIEQGNAKILGMQAAKGKYVLFVDSDEVLENSSALTKTVEAFQKEQECHVAICSGYKRPDDYSLLSGYISDLGDPFSFFVYDFPKDYRFYSGVLRKNYRIMSENKDYFVFDCNIDKKFPLLEGGCGGIIYDMDYFDAVLPEIRTKITGLYHSVYEMLKRGSRSLLFMKKDPLAHYSSDKFSGYLRKLKWRVCNNIHFTEKGKEVFAGRQGYQKYRSFRKYLFIPYAFSIIIPFIHSIPYAISRRNPVYLSHFVLCFYVCFQIIYQYILKLLHITPKFVAYGSNKRIKN